jgi:hypothetical protein
MDDDDLTTLIAADVTGEPDSAYDGIGKWVAVIVLAVCVLAAAVTYLSR